MPTGWFRSLLLQEQVAFQGGSTPSFGPPYDFPNPANDIATGKAAMVINGVGIPNPALAHFPVQLLIEQSAVFGNIGLLLQTRDIPVSGGWLRLISDSGTIAQLEILCASSPGKTPSIVLGAGAGGGDIVIHQSGAATDLLVLGTGAAKIGFFDSIGHTQQTILGAKLALDVVMANLLTALAAYGIIVDGTT